MGKVADISTRCLIAGGVRQGQLLLSRHFLFTYYLNTFFEGAIP